MSDRIFVGELRIGDSFLWCGRVVTLQWRAWGGNYSRGPSHWLHVWNTVEKEKLRIHYYDNELVEPVDPESVGAEGLS